MDTNSNEQYIFLAEDFKRMTSVSEISRHF